MDSLYNWLVLNGIVLLNVIMGFVEMVCDKVDVAVKAIKDSSIPDILIFRDRNEYPLRVKENALPVLKGHHLFYCIADNRFYDFVTSHDSYGTLDTVRLDDIIMAELVDASGVGVCDMSEFFHSVKWSASSQPSVYELVLVKLSMSSICLSKNFLSKCVLNIITLENPSLSIKLNNPLVKDDFVSWKSFCLSEDTPSLEAANVEPLST